MARKNPKNNNDNTDLSQLEAPAEETQPLSPIEQMMAAIIAQSGGLGAAAEDTDRILQLPPGFRPGARATKTESMYSGPGLVDEYGNILKNRDGTIKEKYGDADILLWYNLPFSTRKRYGDLFKKMGLYGRSSPSPTYDQDNDLTVFASVLNTANIEGKTWRAVLPVIQERVKATTPAGTGTRYRPSALSDIQVVLQQEAREALGRELTTEETTPLSQRIQRQETRQQTGNLPEQPIATTTLIQQGVRKRFGAEADAFKAAQFIEEILSGG